MSTFTIPRSIAAADRKLNELGELATATEWQRAAIVAAFVDVDIRPGPQPQSSVDIDGTPISATRFAARGIHGLTSVSTVLIYARAWLDRFPRPEPGRRVTQPTEPWPPTTMQDRRTLAVADREAIEAQAIADGTSVAKALDIAKNRAAMSAAITASGVVADAATAALARRGTTAALTEAQEDAVIEHVARTRPSRLAATIARPGVQAAVDQLGARTRDIYEAGSERSGRIQAAVDESTTALEQSGLVEHGCESFLRMGLTYLRAAVGEYERNPNPTAEQRERIDTRCAEAEHLARLLRDGSETWTSADVDWLRSLGGDVEEVTP